MAVNFAGIFDTELKRLLVGHENVANVHFGDGKLSLWALALTSEVKCKALLVASNVGKCRAGVVVWTLWAEGYTTGHLRVRPNLTLKGLNLENLVLEEHLVLLDGLSDAHVLAVEGSDSSLLASVLLGLGLGGVIGVVAIQVAILIVVLASVDSLLDFFSLLLLFLAELQVEPLLFL